ncbi:MAG: molybdenum cofactor biosynthesis protein MoaE, partial [Cyclobacteriaceae bacterium]
MIVITHNSIDIQNVIRSAESADAGALNVFIGTVRSKTGEKKVIRLEYEAYE